MPRPASALRARLARGAEAQHTGRRVLRTVRRVELWSVFRLALFVYLAVCVLGLLTFVLLWWIASSTGTTGNIESFLRDVGFKGFSFNGPELFLGLALIELALALTATLLTTVVAAMVNLISELTGGIQLVVIESPYADEYEPVADLDPVDEPVHEGRGPSAAPRAAVRDAAAPAPTATAAPAPVTATAGATRAQPLTAAEGVGAAGGGAAGSVVSTRSSAPGEPAPEVEPQTQAARPAREPSANGVVRGNGSWSERAMAILRGGDPAPEVAPTDTAE